MVEIDPSWVGAGGVITAIGTFIAGQRHGKAEFLTAVTKASEIVINRLQKEIDRVEDARERCEAGHEDCRIEVSALKQEVGELLRRQGVAQYKASDLRRVGD